MIGGSEELNDRVLRLHHPNMLSRYGIPVAFYHPSLRGCDIRVGSLQTNHYIHAMPSKRHIAMQCEI
jgi:hypothetical protein